MLVSGTKCSRELALSPLGVTDTQKERLDAFYVGQASSASGRA